MKETRMGSETTNTLPAGFGNAAIQTMNSREIADLCEKRHDNVKRTIEALVEQGVIASPQIEEKPTAGRPVIQYVFAGEQGKRDSIVVVAQLSPEFTARLVDRWQQLEAQTARTAVPSPNQGAGREARLSFKQNLQIAKLAGLEGNQALLAANRATLAMTGIDTLALMGAIQLPAPDNDTLLTPTEIGRRAEVGSARAVNQMLCGMGLQHAFRDAKGHIYYELTDAGQEAGGKMLDTGKKHGTGTPIRQLKWPSSILELIQEGAA